jgi:hypothetical protein
MDTPGLDQRALHILVETFSAIDNNTSLPEKILQGIREIRQIGLDNQDNREIRRSAFLAQTHLMKLLVSIITSNILL